MPRPISRLPSLDLIRGFVAVGRRMSITMAAEDLHLTQSAVSRQIRTLETMLGVKLLKRGHRSISFTPEGDRLFRSANAAIQQLQDSLDGLDADRTRKPVTITSTIGIAALWLLPRLNQFQSDHPGIDIRIAASDKVEDLRGDGIDLAIRYSPAESVPGDAERLFGDTIVPVAHPALGLHALNSTRIIEQQVLLEFDGANVPWLHWREWLASQGWDSVKPKGILRFNQYDQVISAALAGQGIALGRLTLLGSILADGRLRVLSALKPGPVTNYAYWLIKAKSKPRPDVITAAHWIRSQAVDAEFDPLKPPKLPIRRRSPARGDRRARAS